LEYKRRPDKEGIFRLKVEQLKRAFIHIPKTEWQADEDRCSSWDTGVWQIGRR